MISLRHHHCIRRLVQKGGITQKNAIGNRFSSAAVKGIDDDDHLLNEEKKNLDGLFPWRSMPAMPQKTIQDHLSQHVCTYLLRRYYLQGTSIISPGTSYMEVDFLVGAKTAFETSMTAIFNHKQLRAAAILEKQIEEQDNPTPCINTTEKPSIDEIKNFEQSLRTASESKVEEGSTISEDASADKATASGAKSAVDSEQNNVESSEALRKALEEKNDIKAELKDLNNDVQFVPDLAGIFESKLASFYESAIRIGQNPRTKIFHKIEKVGMPYILNHDILFGAKRGIDLTGLTRKKLFGILHHMAIIEKKATHIVAFDERKATVAEKNLLAGRKFATIRILLGIPVTETFYVEDCKTNTLIQGHREPQHNEHSVLFEAVLDSAKSGEIEWTICDIDDWLEGNEFWNFPKIKRAK